MGQFPDLGGERDRLASLEHSCRAQAVETDTRRVESGVGVRRRRTQPVGPTSWAVGTARPGDVGFVLASSGERDTEVVVGQRVGSGEPEALDASENGSRYVPVMALAAVSGESFVRSVAVGHA